MMGIAERIRTDMGDDWIPILYRDKIRGHRTRSYSLEIPQKENEAEILHTLLGVELKVKKKRFACPDLSTARYLRVFVWIGCGSFAIPYDISRISSLADKLESSWYRMLLLLDSIAADKSPQAKGRIKANLIRKIRIEIEEIGAGPPMPEFSKSTRQRNT